MRLRLRPRTTARVSSYVSPAGSAYAPDGKLREHVVDGGYFENSGAATADDIIALLQKNQNSRPFSIHLILIKFNAVQSEKNCATSPPKPPGTDTLHERRRSLPTARTRCDARRARRSRLCQGSAAAAGDASRVHPYSGVEGHDPAAGLAAVGTHTQCHRLADRTQNSCPVSTALWCPL